MEALFHQRKRISINFSKTNTKFCWSLHYKIDIRYLFVNGKETLKFKALNKNINFLAQFYLGSISNGFSAIQSKEVSLNRNMYYF